MKRIIKRLLGQFPKKNPATSPLPKRQLFVYDSLLGVSRRHYATYEEYLRHQAEKLGEVGEAIVQSDREYEALVAARYRDLFAWHGKSILCLGARLGGEVRAFKSLGALAIGIDIEPGTGNCHVLHGDFHDILFPENCFDFAFSNAVDHVFDLDRFVSEVARVLKPGGTLLLELAQVKPGNYEVLDTSDPNPILEPFLKHFRLVDRKSITNQTQYTTWNGLLVQLEKSPHVIENVDRKFRLARRWSNSELRRVAHLLTGDVVNVSAGDDVDKEGQNYKSYFVNARSYTTTNWNTGQYRGFQGRPNEVLLDLTTPLPSELHLGFDIVFNHTTLEHIFDVQTAFANLCAMTRDVLIVVVPFTQVQHEGIGYSDYWRFTPACLRRLFGENGLEVIYESCNNDDNAAVYLFFVGSRHPDRWREAMPPYEPITNAGAWIGACSGMGLADKQT